MWMICIMHLQFRYYDLLILANSIVTFEIAINIILCRLGSEILFKQFEGGSIWKLST